MPKYHYSVVACARWEEQNILEWLEYHRSLGFDHVYIYSNDDDAFTLYNVLLPYLLHENPYVTYRHWPVAGEQLPMYLHFLRHHGHETEWAAFFDVDEFLVLKGINDIGRFLNGFQADWDCVQFNWVVYGNSGRLVRDTRGVLLSLTRREATVNCHTKVMLRPAAISAEQAQEGMDRTRHPFHHGVDNYGVAGLRVGSVLGKSMKGYSDKFPGGASRAVQAPGYSVAVIARAYLAHFAYKSEADFLRRVRRGGFAGQASYREVYESGKYREILATANAVEDTYLYDYWARITGASLRIAPDAGDLPRQLARFKPTWQSSHHRFGPLEEAPSSSAGNDGVKNGGFGFHTGYERAPWWMVDLLDRYAIHEVRVFNRLGDCANRAESLRIDVSLDRATWTALYCPPPPVVFGGADGHPLVVEPTQPPVARYVKLSLRTENCLHLDEVEVLGLQARP